MADENIALNLNINNSQGTKSLSDLKKEFKELQGELSRTKEGSEEYFKTLQKLGAVKDDMGDLRDVINSLNPEGKVAAFSNVAQKLAGGFQAAQGAAALFGAESENVEKALLKVQAATAFAEGIKSITGFSDAFKALNAVMKANPIGAIVVALGLLATAAVAVYNEFFKAGTAAEDFEKKLKRTKEANDALIRSLDAEIIALSGLKANEEKIIEIKRQKLKISIEEQKQSLQAAVLRQQQAEAEITLEERLLELTGQGDAAAVKKMVRTQEAKKETQKAIEDLKMSIAALQGFENEQIQKSIDKHQEALTKYREVAEEKRKIAEHDKEQDAAALAELELRSEEYFNAINDLEAQKAENDRLRLEEMQRAEEVAHENDVKRSERLAQIEKENQEKTRAEKQKTLDTSVDLTRRSLQATQQLTDLYFSYQLNKNRANAEKEREIKKKQFMANKAFSIASIVIDTVLGGIKAISQNPPPSPVGIISAALIGIAGTLATVKVATTKFDDGGSAGGGGDIGNLGAAASSPPPVIPAPNNTVTKLDDSGNAEKERQVPLIIKNEIVESQITQKQNDVAKIKETATY